MNPKEVFMTHPTDLTSRLVEAMADEAREFVKRPLGNLATLEAVPTGSLGDAWEYIMAAVIRRLRKAEEEVGWRCVSVEPAKWNRDTPEGASVAIRRRAAYVAACRQTNCEGRGAAGGEGLCATCADMGDAVIEAYFAASPKPPGAE
jgi:hypothetical protein